MLKIQTLNIRQPLHRNFALHSMDLPDTVFLDMESLDMYLQDIELRDMVKTHLVQVPWATTRLQGRL